MTQLPLEFFMTVATVVPYIGAHHYTRTPFGVLYLDDGYGNPVRTGNVMGAMYFLDGDER